MKCPVCNKHELVIQSLEDSFGHAPDHFCPEIITLPGGKILNHYREFQGTKQVRMIVPPYRVLTESGCSKVSLQSRYKTGSQGYYFKTILKIPILHPDSQENLLKRIKLLMLLS
jgi:hypothetical protein